MNFPALLHFSKQRGVFLAAGHQQQAGGFPVESADQGEKLARVFFAKPVDQGEGAVWAGGMNKPPGWFVDHEEPGVGSDDGGRGIHVVMGSIPVDRW